MLRDTLARFVLYCIICGFLTFCSGGSSLCAADMPQPAQPWNQVTHASWYGAEFAGRPMAAGGRFNPERLTAAHRTLALGTWVRVTELNSNRAVVVQITDRGPYTGKRGLDLSYAAARQLGMVRRGVARVRIELAENEKPSPAKQAPQIDVVACKTNPMLLTPAVEWRSAAARYSPEARRSEITS